MIRIAQRGWNRDRGAETAADVQVGVGVYWVEIDGVRIERVVRVEFVADEGEVTLPRLTIEVADGLEVVYVDGDGNPLPGDPVPAERFPTVTAGIVVRREDLHTAPDDDDAGQI